MMAVVTLNRLVLEEAIAHILESIQTSVRDFETAAERVQVRAGSAVAQEVRDCNLMLRRELGTLFEDFRVAKPTSIRTSVASIPPVNGSLLP